MVGSNEELVNRLHNDKLKKWRKRPLARPESYLSRMLFAVKRLPFPIESASNAEIQQHLMELDLKPTTRFEVVRAINEVLKYLARAGLTNPRPSRPDEVTYVSAQEFLQKASALPEEYRLYLGGLFATGCRYGELPKCVIRGGWAYVGQQIRSDGRVWATKNHKKRHAPVLPVLSSFIMGYKALSEGEQTRLRVGEYNRIYGAARRVLGANIHTLRHSYAIECVLAGKTVEDVAKYIGDTVEVAQRNYIGYLAPKDSPWG